MNFSWLLSYTGKNTCYLHSVTYYLRSHGHVRKYCFIQDKHNKAHPFPKVNFTRHLPGELHIRCGKPALLDKWPKCRMGRQEWPRPTPSTQLIPKEKDGRADFTCLGSQESMVLGARSSWRSQKLGAASTLQFRSLLDKAGHEPKE